MFKLRIALIAVLFAFPAFGGAQQRPGSSASQPLVDSKRMRAQPEDAESASRVFVFGDETKPGLYVYRNTFAAGQTSRPHYHTGDRVVTVIKGTWWTGEGDVLQPDKMIAIKQGGVMLHPAGLHHYDGSKGSEPVTVQIVGIGPIDTISTERK